MASQTPFSPPSQALPPQNTPIWRLQSTPLSIRPSPYPAYPLPTDREQSSASTGFPQWSPSPIPLDSELFRDVPIPSTESQRGGHYAQFQKEDETILFRLCEQNKLVYTGRKRGSGIIAFYKRVAAGFEAHTNRKISYQTARKRVEKPTDLYIERITNGTTEKTGEEEEDTQWLTAMKQ
jgi:hypothetical protein